MIASIGAYDDPELTAYLEGLVDEIVSVSEKSDEKFTLRFSIRETSTPSQLRTTTFTSIGA